MDYQDGQVVSKTLVQNSSVSMTLFSFDKGEEISTHAAGGDAMVTVLDGTGRFTVGGEVFILSEGETLIMPKNIPHAVYGEERFKQDVRDCIDKYSREALFIFDHWVFGDPDNELFNERNRWMTEVVEDYGLHVYGNN